MKINGIAHAKNENLREIFCSIAELVGFDVSNPLNMPDIVRMQRVNQQHNDFIQLPVIIVKFVATHIRNTFYGLYLAKATKDPILSEQLNLTQGSTVRIGEVLTPQNQLIFTEAIKLKRDKKLLKVNTLDGIVRVKNHQTERYVTIKSKRDLGIYIGSKEKAATHQKPPLQEPSASNVTANNGINTTGTPLASSSSTAALTNGTVTHTQVNNNSNNVNNAPTTITPEQPIDQTQQQQHQSTAMETNQ